MREIFLSILLLSGSFIKAQTPTLMWAHRMAGELNLHANSMVVDLSGNVYTTGSFTGTLDFDPDPMNVFTLTNSSSAMRDAFVMKMNAAGQFQWAIRIGGAGDDNGSCIQLDPQGNVVIAGIFAGTVDFDPGVGTYNLASNDGIFLLTLSPSANFVRAAHFESTGTQTNPSLSIDLLGNMYVSGEFTGQTDFDPDTAALATYYLTASTTSSDMFIVKLNDTGHFIRAIQLGSTSGQELIKNLKADPFGNIYLAGRYFTSTLDLDPGPGIANLPNAPGGDIFILKLDSATNFKWARAFNGNLYSDFAWDIDVDKQGNVLTIGQFRDTLDLDPSPSGTYLLTDPGHLRQAFLSKLDSSGQFVWAGAIGGAGDDYGFSFTIDDSSNIYLTGHCISNSPLDLDPGPGVDTVAGGSTFIVKLDSICQYRWGVRIGGTSSIEYGTSIAVDASFNVITTGQFNSIGDYDPGDSVLTLVPNGGYRLYLQKMSQCSSLPSSILLAACDSVLHDGQYYTTSGSYPLYYQNAAGCDSLVELNVDVRYSNSYSYAATACLSYSDLSGTAWDTSGIYTLTLTNNAGCDSVVTVDLTIEEIDTTVIQSGDTLWPQSPSVLYIWIDCNTGNPVVFSGLPYFVPTSSGNYAVVLQFGNGCQDTSSCHQVTLTGINEITRKLPFILRPNPGEGIFSWNEEIKIDELDVYDVTGRKIEQRFLKDNIHSVDLRPLENGFYLIFGTASDGSEWYGKVEIQK
ncbi:MAG: hypothetical protein IPN36_10700 [Bacteroidetes bacterium]|nr:hypothetical protein [Bacteroidota bacterium]